MQDVADIQSIRHEYTAEDQCENSLNRTKGMFSYELIAEKMQKEIKSLNFVS
jgi:hypothetical protein